MNSRFLPLTILLVLGLVAQASLAPVFAKDPVSTGILSNLAVSGHDPVAYFTQGKPVEGNSDHEYEWNGATWRFSSAENLNAFKSDPQAFAPQYGGYCAWAVSQGYTAPSDPQAWRIVDDKLYLNYSKKVQQNWVRDIPGNIAEADKNWPKVLDK
ncbi:MAG: YHS domain-containing protein [Alphaproteobacteria bacterium]|nr:YHS domain-containing protein [Alphaproteobacteria bacterium]